jgi:hypothetical protein
MATLVIWLDIGIGEHLVGQDPECTTLKMNFQFTFSTGEFRHIYILTVARSPWILLVRTYQWPNLMQIGSEHFP